jgi:mono/diheme cytochrome c family protein
MPLFGALLALLNVTGLAYAQNPIARGHALIQEFCAECHAIGKTDQSPHIGAPPLRNLSRSYDLDDFPRMLERGISSGHPDMPTFNFSGKDARAARDYLRTIQE